MQQNAEFTLVEDTDESNIVNPGGMQPNTATVVRDEEADTPYMNQPDDDPALFADENGADEANTTVLQYEPQQSNVMANIMAF